MTGPRQTPNGDRWEWNPTLETQVREIVREEIRAAFAGIENVAEDMYRSDGVSQEEDPFTAVARVANVVLARMACKHERASQFGSQFVCRSCGQEWTSAGEGTTGP